VLLIADEQYAVHQIDVLEAIGFRVTRKPALPDDDTLLNYEVVIVILPTAHATGPFAARARARRHFGRRVLIALVPDTVPEVERRRAASAGLDGVLPASIPGRMLAAFILQRLRAFPEHRCKLQPRRSRPAA
jgi:hypothetical protein